MRLSGLECLSSSVAGSLGRTVALTLAPVIVLLLTGALYLVRRCVVGGHVRAPVVTGGVGVGCGFFPQGAWVYLLCKRRKAAGQAVVVKQTAPHAAPERKGSPLGGLAPNVPYSAYSWKPGTSGVSLANRLSPRRVCCHCVLLTLLYFFRCPASPRHRRQKLSASSGSLVSTRSLPVSEHDLKLHQFGISCRRAGLYTLYLAFMPLLTQTLEVFPCGEVQRVAILLCRREAHPPFRSPPLHITDTDELGRSYMRAQPSIACDGSSPERSKVLAVAVVGCLLNIVVVPCFMVWLLRKYWNRRSSPSVYKLMGFVYGCYRPQMHWFVAVATLRKLFIGALVALVRPGLFARCAVALALLSLFTLQLVLKPYKYPRENLLESLSLCSILFVLLLMAFAEGTPNSAGADRVGTMVVFILITTGVVFCFMLFIKRCERVPAAASAARTMSGRLKRTPRLRRCCCGIMMVGVVPDSDDDTPPDADAAGSSRRSLVPRALRRRSVVFALGRGGGSSRGSLGTTDAHVGSAPPSRPQSTALPPLRATVVREPDEDVLCTEGKQAPGPAGALGSVQASPPQPPAEAAPALAVASPMFTNPDVLTWRTNPLTSARRAGGSETISR